MMNLNHCFLIRYVSGDMVLYESHSVIHGRYVYSCILRDFLLILPQSNLLPDFVFFRPFPMQGNFYANFFVHFETLGRLDGESDFDFDSGLPPYLIPGSVWEQDWKNSNPGAWRMVS